MLESPEAIIKPLGARNRKDLKWISKGNFIVSSNTLSRKSRERYFPYACAAGMLLHINREFVVKCRY